MTAVQNSKRGTSLIEVMIAALILTIIIMGGSFFYVASTNQINLREQHRVASRLAAQKLEDLKAGNYSDIAVGKTTDDPLGSGFYSRSTVTEDMGTYKKVTVDVIWGTPDNSHNVSVVTFIAPK